MDKMIVIPMNLFNFTQEVLIVDNNTTKTLTRADFTSLPEVVTEACNAFGIENIKILGNTNYAQALLNEIQEYSVNNYSNKNLNISIMEV